MQLTCQECSNKYKGNPGGRFCSKACRLLWENKQINERWKDKQPFVQKVKRKLNLRSVRDWD